MAIRVGVEGLKYQLSQLTFLILDANGFDANLYYLQRNH